MRTLVIVLLLSWSLTTHAEVWLSPRLSQSQKTIIKSSLDHIENNHFTSIDENPLNLWLKERLHFIFSPSEKISWKILSKPVTYPNLVIPAYTEALLTAQNSSQDTASYLSNKGVAFYLAGKKQGRLSQLKLAGNETLDIYSPRVGIIQMGSYFFQESTNVEEALLALRTSQLIHEARHSDGNKENIGFLHRHCPKDSDWDGMMVCDFSSNGAYAAEAQFLMQWKSLFKLNITPRILAVLNVEQLVAQSRIFSNESADSTPEEIAH